MATIESFKFDENISNELKKVSYYGKDIGDNWPVVYLLNDKEEAYIGETHHISVRMSQHLANAAKRRLTEMRLITGSDFNKSVILDLEAFLIKHMSSDGRYKLLNGNHGLQDHDYYQRSQYNDVFRRIWNRLHSEMINLLQNIEGKLFEREVLFERIDTYLGLSEEDRRLFQLLRRTFRAYGPEDMKNLAEGEKKAMKNAVMAYSESDWDIKMNEYICRYV